MILTKCLGEKELMSLFRLSGHSLEGYRFRLADGQEIPKFQYATILIRREIVQDRILIS